MMVTRTWSSQESKTLRHPAEAAEKTSSVAKRSPPAQMISREAEEAMSLTGTATYQERLQVQDQDHKSQNRKFPCLGHLHHRHPAVTHAALHARTERCRSVLTVTAPSLVTARHIRSHGVRSPW
jgi:hypothetical protein